MSDNAGLEKLQALVGQEVGLSDWMNIDQDRINKFAECTDDHQWIHVDEEKAARGPYGVPIAQGFLTISLITTLSDCINLPLEGLNVKMGLNYGLDKVRFLSPVKVNSNIRTRVVLQEIKEKGAGRIFLTYAHTIEIEGEEKPACVAEHLGMIILE